MIIGLSMKESAQIAIFEKLKNKEISVAGAARSLGFTTRWVREKSRRYVQQGVQGLVHTSRNKKSNKRWNQAERDFAIDLLRGAWSDFGPTLASQKLEELYNIKVSRETLRKAMIDEDIWLGKKRKIQYRKRRERKDYYGEMVQLDGSPHDWFEGRGPRCTLINFVDDATSSVPFMMLAENESHSSVMTALRKYIEINGIPKSLYVDYGGVFSVNINNPERDKKTQFERACKELGIDIIHASSPQAKGRVERSHGTHQDRLVKELRLAGITTIKEANNFILSVYLPMHNKKFAIAASKSDNIHRTADHINMDKIFCVKEVRKLQNDFTLSYKNRILQLSKQQRAVIHPRETIIIHEHFDGGLKLYIRGIQLNYIEVKHRPIKPSEDLMVKERFFKPSANHPWRGPNRRVLITPLNGGY